MGQLDVVRVLVAVASLGLCVGCGPRPPPAGPSADERMMSAGVSSGTAIGAPPAATVTCGDTACAPTDICISISIGQPTPSPDQSAPAPTLHYECSPSPVSSSSAIECSSVSAGRQSCVGLVTPVPPPRH